MLDIYLTTKSTALWKLQFISIKGSLNKSWHLKHPVELLSCSFNVVSGEPLLTEQSISLHEINCLWILQKIYICVFTVLTLNMSSISHIKGPMICWKTRSAGEVLKVETGCSVKNMFVQVLQIIHIKTGFLSPSKLKRFCKINASLGKRGKLYYFFSWFLVFFFNLLWTKDLMFLPI